MEGKNWENLELLEYEQFFGISQGNLEYDKSLYKKELLINYRDRNISS